MVLFNYATKELTAKVVYYGPGLCGKTTNLQFIHERLPVKNKGKMLSLATETDRTLFFDFLPIELGTIRGMKTRIQLYTVPGQVFYNATRRMVLKGADCVVFVADSQEPMLEPNLESFRNLRENLEANEINPDEIPMVLQFNKRDLPNALPIEILNERLNGRNHPFYEAIAVSGIGVEDTLRGATALVFRSLSGKYGDGSAASSLQKAAAAPPNAAPAAVAPAAAPRPAPAAPRPAAAVPRPAAAAAASPVKPVPAVAAGPVAPSRPTAPPPRPVPVPPPAPPQPAAFGEVTDPVVIDDEPLELDVEPARVDPRETLVRGETEAASLRRKIAAQPAAAPSRNLPSLELQLEELTEDAPEEEELTLEPDAFAEPLEEAEPVPIPPPPPPEPVWAPKKVASPVWTRAAEAPLPVPESGAELEPEPFVPPAAHVVEPPARPQVSVSRPVSIEVAAIDGPTEVTIPVDVHLEDGIARVNIQLRLTLNLKLQ